MNQAQENGSSMSVEPPAENLVEVETMLCPCCLCPNIPDAAFCKDCGAPLGSCVFLDPFLQIHGLGFILRRATGGPPNWKVLLGVYVIFFPMFVNALVVFGVFFQQQHPNPVDMELTLFHALYTGTFLYQATMNYMNKSKNLMPESPQEETPSAP